MAEPFIGQLMCVGFNFAPPGWAVCDGSLLQIAQNTALFSLLGTTYGGDGRVTFGLPDLRGRVPVGQGNGPGLPGVVLGQVWGSASTTLTLANLPAHNHTVPGDPCNTGPATTNNPQGAYPAPVAVSVTDANGDAFTSSTLAYANTATPNATMGGGATTGITGNSTPLSLQPPSVGMFWMIATQGIFPTRP